MRLDDDLSYCGSVGNRSRGASSLRSGGAFSIDWDEIDSIAEESVSVASSVSSGHRKRRTASSRRRNHSASHLEALEAGSLSRSLRSNGSESRSSSSRSSNSNNVSISSSRRQMRKAEALRKLTANVKKIGALGASLVLAVGSLHTCGTFVIHHLPTSYPTFSLGLGDRQTRRQLSRSTSTYSEFHWPISVRDEQDDFEALPHPANNEVAVALPRFFLSQEDGSMQTMKAGFSKKTTEILGSTTVEGSKDFSVRTIFVAMPSYRDWHCRYTIENLFARAKYPERIRVGVVDQIEAGTDPSCDLPVMPCSTNPDQALCRYRDQIDVYEMEASLSVGPTFARHVAQRMYRGEFYTLQIDSHTTFVRSWDASIIEQMENTGNEMAVLTTYLTDASGGVDENTGRPTKESRLVICNAAYEGSGRDRRLRHDIQQQPDTLPSIKGMPQLQPYFSSDFAFARGHFLLTVPYDPNLPMVRKGDEEISMAVRAFTHGYDLYTPERNVAYDSASNEKEAKKSFLQNAHLYKGQEHASLVRLYGIIGMDSVDDESTQPDDMFGIGHVRSLSKFFNSFGVHPKERITERKLCNFVSTGRMHKIFYEHMQSDGMGINYDGIHFRFHELQNNHEGGT